MNISKALKRFYLGALGKSLLANEENIKRVAIGIFFLRLQSVAKQPVEISTRILREELTHSQRLILYSLFSEFSCAFKEFLFFPQVKRVKPEVKKGAGR